MNTDIVPPTVAQQPNQAPEGAPEPVTDTSTAPVQSQEAVPTELPIQKAPEVSKPDTGVAMAIAATVIIVLGLAALATYAYLKTK